MNSLPQYNLRGAAKVILNNYMSPHTPENNTISCFEKKAMVCNDTKTVNTKNNILERTIIISTTYIYYLTTEKT